MQWKMLTSDPITTEPRRAVFDHEGQEGWISVRWRFGRPEFYGAVTDSEGTVLDTSPSFVGTSTSYAWR